MASDDLDLATKPERDAKTRGRRLLKWRASPNTSRDTLPRRQAARRGSSPGVRLAAIPVVFLAFFFLAPIGQMLVFSFYTFDPMELIVQRFTLSNWAAVAGDSYVQSILFRTIRVAFFSTVLSALVAFPIAYRMRQAVGLEKMFLSLIALSPLMVSLVVLGYSWVVILAPNTGLLNTTLKAVGLPPAAVMFTEKGVVIGLFYQGMVYMVLSLHAALENIDEHVLRAARVLGASSLQVFRRVILPLSFPGLVSGSLVVFSISASALVMPLLLGGRQVPVLATYAYDMASVVLNWPSASAIAGVLALIAAAVIMAYTSWVRAVERRLGIVDEREMA